jgi:hypothetical protein
VVVCLLPGAEVAFERERGRHHDALEFPNGEIVIVTRLYEGQHATVLQLPASPRAINEVEDLCGNPVMT